VFGVNFSPAGLDADIVFMHYPMHNAEELYLSLEEKFRKELKSGTLLISAIRKLADATAFPSVAQPLTVRAKYGNCTMHFHKKT
jgi:nucleoside diphosphate kinase